MAEVTPTFEPNETAREDHISEERSNLPLWWFRAAFIGGVCAVIVGSLLPGEFMPALFNDKAEHFLAYAALTAAGGFACRNRQDRLLLALFLFVLAVGLELAQRLSPGRTTEFADALAGWMGTCTAFILLRLARVRTPK